MTVDKRINYEMQGGSKPARNYLGKQKTVSNVPVKWKSGPDHPETELAYITKAEKDLLVKKDLHGSLKNGPNTGPDGIMSLNDQGDYTRDRSPAGKAPGVGGGHSNYMNQQIQQAHDAKMKSILTGQQNIGQTVQTGPRTRQYSNLPEIMTMPDGTTKYIGSAYKSYGQPSFFGNLFSRGAPGYRGIKGLPAWGDPMKNYQLRGIKNPITGQITPNEEGEMGYYTDKEDFAETRDAFPNFGILGILKQLFGGKKQPKDMSEFNKLSLTAPADQKVYIPKGGDVPMARMDPWSTPITKEAITGYNDMIPGQETNFVNQNAPGPWNDFNRPATNLNTIDTGYNDMIPGQETKFVNQDAPGPWNDFNRPAPANITDLQTNMDWMGGMDNTPSDLAAEYERLGLADHGDGMSFSDFILEKGNVPNNVGVTSLNNNLENMIIPVGMNEQQKEKALKEMEWGVAPETVYPKLQSLDDTKWWGGKEDTKIRPNEFIEYWEKQTGQTLSDDQKRRIFKAGGEEFA